MKNGMEGPSSHKEKKPDDGHEHQIIDEAKAKLAELVTAFNDLRPQTRRNVLIGGAAAGTVAAGAAVLGGVSALEGSHKPHNAGTTEAVPFHRAPFSTGNLAGRKVHDLYAYYLGQPDGSELPETIDPDFGDNMEKLWDKKLARVDRTNPDWDQNMQRAKEHFSDTYKKSWEGNEVQAENLTTLVQNAQAVIDGTMQSLEWNELNRGGLYGSHMGKRETAVVMHLAEKITPEMLIAYSITELMPYIGDKGTELDRMPTDVYELLLEHAGVDFVVNLPSINDSRLSTGMYQFTSDALYDVPNEAPRGASIINRMISDPNVKIPGSVLALDTAEKQIRAALLFSIDNLARLVTKISSDSDKAEHRLRQLVQDDPEAEQRLLQYIASAHHNPAEARDTFIKWMDQNFEGHEADLCDDRIKNYIRSAHVNYQEVHRRETA